MKINEITVETDSNIWDADFLDSGKYILSTENGAFFVDGKRFEVDIRVKHRSRFRVRFITENKFLIIDGWEDTEWQEVNAWIVNKNGKVENTLSLGPLHKLIVIQDKIIVSYSDCRCGDDDYGKGMNFYNLEGELLYQYNKENQLTNRWIMCNYGFLKKDEKSFYFMPYNFHDNGLRGNFIFVEYNIETQQQKVLFCFYDCIPSVPTLDLKNYGPIAFSKKGLNWHIVAEKENSKNYYIIEVDSSFNVSNIKELDQTLRSWRALMNGKFIALCYQKQGEKNYDVKKIQIIEI